MNYLCREITDDLPHWHLSANDENLEQLGIDIFPLHGFKSCSLSRNGRVLQPGLPEWQQLLTAYPLFGNMILYPTPNRVRNGEFTYDGKTIQMVKHGTPRTQHGLANDSAWKVTDVSENASKASISAELLIQPGDDNYTAFPFKSRLLASYSISSDRVCFNYTVTNLSECTLPFGIGLHPWFLLYKDSCSITLKVPADYYYETDSDLLPTGKLLPVTSAAQHDLNSPQQVQSLNLDTVYLLNSRDPIIIRYEDFGYEIQIHTSEEFRHSVIYTAFNRTEAFSSDRAAFCVENQTCCTDAINMKNKGFSESGLLELLPNESTHGHIEYVFSSLSGTSAQSAAN